MNPIDGASAGHFGPVADGRVPLADVLDSGLVDSLPAAVYTARVGADGEWLYVSSQIEAILGFTPADLLADPGLWARQLHPDDRQRVLDEEDQMLTSPQPGYSDYRMLRRDGRVVWLLDDMSVVDDPEYGVVQQGLLYDITRRKRTELLLAVHADIVERVVRGDDLAMTLAELARATDRVSAGHCLIRVARTPELPDGTEIEASGRTDAPHNPAEPGWDVPFLSSSGEELGRFLIRYSQAAQPPEEDREIAVWAARLAAMTLERAAHDERMATSLSLLEATLESTADGILVVDRAGRIVGHNQKFRELWRIPEDLLASRDDDRVIESVLEQLSDPEGFLDHVRALYEQPDASSCDILEFVDGRVFERFSQPQRVEGRSVGRVWSFRDMTAQRKLQDELWRQAYRDSLTPLPNRALFMERLSAALAKSVPAGRAVAVLLLDIDDFKTINDGLGHTAGDALLIEVAHRLLQCLRESDTAARLGGDEFVVLLSDVAGAGEARAVSERILTALSAPVVIEGRRVSARASIGISVSTSERPVSAADLLRDADLAMYHAKRDGGNGYQFFEVSMHDSAVARLELTADLEHALDRGELLLHYQPIYHLTTGSVVGAEALVRWQHPRRGLVSPTEFISLAEETGAIDRIGRWVVSQACGQLHRWRNRLPEAAAFTMSVNLSPRQLWDGALAADMEQILRMRGIAPSSLVLEITEGALAQQSVDVVGALGTLKRMGVSLALDDFGTGYSSLGYLDRYPLDIVKIDRSFVTRLGPDDGDSAMVKAVLQLARALDLEVIAEGVETAGQLESLRRLGCASGQGFHLSRPVPATEFEAILRDGLASDAATA